MEIIVNGQVVASKNAEADGEIHDLRFDVEIDRSSWIALRQFPQLHTNPVTIIVDDEPIRASRRSALWCAESVRLLWKNRRRFIHVDEQPAAREAYQRAIVNFLQRADECGDDGTRMSSTELETD